MLLIAAVVLPFVVTGYQLFQITMALSYAIALLGLNILTGYNGQLSLGHGAFYALGAYTTAILMDRFGVAYYLTIPLAGALAFVAGFLFGRPALRLGSMYLALATFALAIATPQVLKAKFLAAVTGGVGGLVLMKPEVPAGLPLDQDQWLYFVTLLVVILAFRTAATLIDSRVGQALIALREHPLAAEAMGINGARYKSAAFGISAAYTGIAGALGAILVQFVAPDSFTFFLSISFLVGIVVGGLASLTGSLVGAAFIQFVPNVAEALSKAVPWAIYGVVLILCVFFMPMGVAGVLRKLSRGRLGS